MLKIGWSQRDVSTMDPVCITGQMWCRIAKGVLDPVMVTCLVMEDGEDCAIFLSGDFENGSEVIDVIRAKVAKRNGEIPVEKIIFNVTHTHTAPLIQKHHPYLDAPHEGIEITPPEVYREFMTDRASEAVIEAWESRAKGTFAYGYGYAVVGHSRRVSYLDDVSLRPNAKVPQYKSTHSDGHVKMYGNTNDDMFAGYEGGADHFINLMYTFDKDGKLTGAVINVPCPSQNSEIEWVLSANYWNEVRVMLREKYGDITILPQCAAAGDTCPNLQHYGKAQERRFALKYADYALDKSLLSPTQMISRMEIAKRICDAFDEVLSWCAKEKIGEAPIKHTVKTVYLDKFLISDEQYRFCLDELAEIKKSDYVNTGDPGADFRTNTLRATGIYRFESIIKRYEMQKTEKKAPVELHVIRIGDIAFATSPFELYQDFQHRIQARSPFTQTFVVQLCGQPDDCCGISYLATERALANKGYSATMFSCEVSPEGGRTLVEETVAELKKLR